MIDAWARRRLLVATILAVVVHPAAPASARGGGRARFRSVGLAGRGTYGPGVLTQDLLERCVRLESGINTNADAIDATQVGLELRSAEIERLGRDVNARAARLDRTSQAAVDGYNSLATQHRSMVNTFNARLPALNARVEAHNMQVNDFNANCAAKSYYEADMRSLRSRLGLD